MINNICENNKSIQQTAVATKTTIVDKRHNDKEKDIDVATTATNTKNNIGNCRIGGIVGGGGSNLVQTTYGHGIWYSEIIDGVSNNTNTNNNNPIYHKQQYHNSNNSSNNNNNENIVNRNVWSKTTRCNFVKEPEKQSSHNECDIIIVDIENEDNNDEDELERQHQQQQQQPKPPTYIEQPPKFSMNANVKFSQKQPTINDNVHCWAKTNITRKVNSHIQNRANDKNHVIMKDDNNVDRIEVVGDVDDEHDNEEDDDDEDSLASMETLSDNVSIWIDGEKHWVAGVDANTTCSDLIWALLNYQNGQHNTQSVTQQHHQQQLQQQHQHTFASSAPSTNEENISTTVINKTNNNQYERQQQLLQQQQQEQQPKVYDKNLEFSLTPKIHENASNLYTTDHKPNILHTASTNKTTQVNDNKNTSVTVTATSTITASINQSMPINTKENCKIIPNSIREGYSSSSAASATAIISSSTPVSVPIPPTTTTTTNATLLPLTLPPGITTVSQLATEYVIVKQYHHCEEYLDGSTKVFDVLPPRDGSNKKQCELLLRHLGPAPAVYINNTTPQLSSLISTDKDSGMGSPVGSARSAKFRRRKHKSSQWLAQANTLHPKLSRCMGNERLMKIILAQDETIQRQLSLLREKERQITKIEEEKHRKRERELGKNYLLETYLNGLDEAECEPEIQDGEEIFIDEPYHRSIAAVAAGTTTTLPATLLTTNSKTTITPQGVTFTVGAVTDKIPSSAEAFNMMMVKHKLKDKDKDVKKEKKKKRHKEKSTKDDGVPAKDFNLKTNKNKDKEKEKMEKQHQHHNYQQQQKPELNGNINNKDNDNEQEIEMQILWLEKIYTLNKQLQKEEELAAKLHAKVRKHQLRKAQQTQHEVQMEIDKLDNNLALQCGDIRKIEANLMQTNEQLQKKLMILERLSIEYLQEQQEKDNNNHNTEALKDNNERETKVMENPLKNDANTLLTNLVKSIDIQKLSLNNIKSKEEVIKLEKIIAKPSLEIKEDKNTAITTTAATATSTTGLPTTSESNNPLRVNMKTNTIPQANQQLQQRFSNDTRINSLNDATNSSNRNLVTNNQQQPQNHSNYQQQQHQVIYNPSATMSSSEAASAAGTHTLHNEMMASSNNDTVSTSCLFIDKNMLSSLHVQNAKTIKKQMFHTQTTTTPPPQSSHQIGKVPVTTLSSALQQAIAPPAIVLGNAFPKQQFQHILQQQQHQQPAQQHMPMASKFLTSRPLNSHQMPVTNIVLVQQPSSSSSSTSASVSNLTAISSSSSSSPLTSSSLAASTSATVSHLIASHQPHPISASPSPSILAMNTVDISQLGTLV
ncbi:uncharacterized protein ACRADG_001399 isoform 1-T7 [Cochliomyia hominivorax]